MAATTADVDRYRANRQDEIDSAAVTYGLGRVIGLSIGT
jgi:hypothetical protein